MCGAQHEKTTLDSKILDEQRWLVTKLEHDFLTMAIDSCEIDPEEISNKKLHISNTRKLWISLW